MVQLPQKQSNQWFSYAQLKQYVPYIIGVLVVIGGLFGAKWYFSGEREKAQRVYAEAVEQYRRGLSGIGGAWEDLEFITEVGYKHHKSSVFGPYFLALKAEAQLQQDKITEALKTSDQMLNQLPKNSPLYFVYKTKGALLKLDSGDQDIQQKGLAELQQAASDKKNINSDEAQYYLGLYQLIRGNKEEAKQAWVALVEEQGVYEAEKASPWAQLAESKLTGL